VSLNCTSTIQNSQYMDGSIWLAGTESHTPLATGRFVDNTFVMGSRGGTIWSFENIVRQRKLRSFKHKILQTHCYPKLTVYWLPTHGKCVPCHFRAPSGLTLLPSYNAMWAYVNSCLVLCKHTRVGNPVHLARGSCHAGLKDRSLASASSLNGAINRAYTNPSFTVYW
jgi:hypothetical protein